MRAQRSFKLVTGLEPQGDQPAAIDHLCRGLESGDRHQVLLGVTGSGKTFTMAQRHRAGEPADAGDRAEQDAGRAALRRVQADSSPTTRCATSSATTTTTSPRPTSRRTDTYIEKDASINDEIDKMRHSATKALLERNDVIIVASVSCIYGLGSPRAYFEHAASSSSAAQRDRPRPAAAASWSTSSTSATTSTSTAARSACAATSSRSSRPTRKRARCASSSSATTIEAIAEIDPLRGKAHARARSASRSIRPATTSRPRAGLEARGRRHPRRAARSASPSCAREDKLLEAQRLEQRTLLRPRDAGGDGLLSTASRTTRAISTAARPGEPPPTLLDYFPEDFLLFIDESHVTVPQIGGMYRGDRSRKETLVEYGFRLPSALDNRPLNFAEFEALRRADRSTSRRRPATTSSSRAGGRGRRADHPADRADRSARSRCGRRASRSTTCSRRSARASRRASACW